MYCKLKILDQYEKVNVTFKESLYYTYLELLFYVKQICAFS